VLKIVRLSCSNSSFAVLYRRYIRYGPFLQYVLHVYNLVHMLLCGTYLLSSVVKNLSIFYMFIVRFLLIFSYFIKIFSFK